MSDNRRNGTGVGDGDSDGHGGVDGVEDFDIVDADGDFDGDLDDVEMGDDELDDDGELLSVDDAVRSLMRRPKESREGHGPIQRLYRGETKFDFVGRRRVWFTISTVVIVAGIISLILRGGLNLGIEFKGGTEWTVKAPHVTQSQAVDAMQSAGLVNPIVQLLGQGSNQQLNVQADLNKLSAEAQKAETLRVEEALAKLTDTSLENVQNGVQTVGPTWGSSITNKAIEALIIFFVVVGIYISIRFEPKMALSAFIAMVHDVVVAVGIYSLFNFQVTPDTVVAILTILGYSLYDTVVVFDRVRDNTKNIGSHGTMTYGQLINLSMNQTLARSINTSAVAIIPVLSVLLIGAELLGASTLQEYGLALFVGSPERGLLLDLHRVADPLHAEAQRAALAGDRKACRVQGRPHECPFRLRRRRPQHPVQHRGGWAAPQRRAGQADRADPARVGCRRGGDGGRRHCGDRSSHAQRRWHGAGTPSPQGKEEAQALSSGGSPGHMPCVWRRCVGDTVPNG